VEGRKTQVRKKPHGPNENYAQIKEGEGKSLKLTWGGIGTSSVLVSHTH